MFTMFDFFDSTFMFLHDREALNMPRGFFKFFYILGSVFTA